MDARSTAPDAADGSTTPALNSPKHGGQGSFSGEHVPGMQNASTHRAPGFVNRMDDLLPGMAGTVNAVEERNEEENKADETVLKGGAKGNLGWAVSGLLAKTTMLTIHSAKDGMLGKMTEVGVHQPVLDDTAEGRATQDGHSSEQGADAELGGRQEEEEDRMVMFENEEEGTVTMKDEIKVQFSAFPTPLSHSRTLGIWGA